MTDDNGTATAEVSTESPREPAEASAGTLKLDPQTPGAPLGNSNAMRHGLRAGKFPPGTEYLQKQIQTFRRAAEAAVIATRGQIGFIEVAMLQTAMEHYSHGLRVRRWLRVGWEQLSSDQRLAFSREIGRTFDLRDKVLKQLGLEKRDEALTTLYQLPPDEPEPEQEGQTNAPAEPPA